MVPLERERKRRSVPHGEALGEAGPGDDLAEPERGVELAGAHGLLIYGLERDVDAAGYAGDDKVLDLNSYGGGIRVTGVERGLRGRGSEKVKG